MNCHTIGGGRLTGPDLKDVTKRQSREWLVNFLQNPKAVLDSGDPYAARIFEESRRVPMPLAPGMNRERAEKLLDLIEAESKLPESQLGLESRRSRSRRDARPKPIFGQTAGGRWTSCVVPRHARHPAARWRTTRAGFTTCRPTERPGFAQRVADGTRHRDDAADFQRSSTQI
jgi:hypothetical protein